VHVLTFECTQFVENCYILRDGDEAIVIDPGEVTPGMRAALEGVQVNMIFNTHCHIDHSGGNAEMVRLTGAPLICHAADLPLLRALPQQARLFNVEVAESPDPDAFVEEGDEVSVGGITMRVAHTPGHSPGHVTLVGEGFVFSGDVLFSGSIGRTDLPGGNHESLLQSIKKHLLPLPDDTVVYCGHGPTTTIGRERKSNPFMKGL
jgi:hydroxyacylglutathione hydrolase